MVWEAFAFGQLQDTFSPCAMPPGTLPVAAAGSVRPTCPSYSIEAATDGARQVVDRPDLVERGVKESAWG